jgi:NAD(P)-dependent dehydrogenase (short-subunit alcohol dehydrogenase family)
MNPVYDFNGQVALVTGAGKGMGWQRRGCSPRAAPRLCWRILTGILPRRRQSGSSARAASPSASPATSPTRRRSRRWSIVQSQSTAGSTWRSTMQASRCRRRTPPDEPIENFERVTAVNQRGVWAGMKHELRVMRDQGSGAIVNCSSLGGLVGLPQRAAYHGTKHAVLGMTKSAGVEYAPRGTRINAVCPGTIDTPMVSDMLEGQADAMAEIMKQQSIGRLGRADEVAAAVLWLCSRAQAS